MIAWADVRWRFQRRNLNLPQTSGAIGLELLTVKDDELIDSVIDVHEALVGQPRSDDLAADLEALVGDYRLARGLATTLSDWYHHVTPSFDEAAGAAIAHLRARAIEKPADVRRLLWEEANRSGGFAAGSARQAVADLKKFLDHFHGLH